MYSDDGVLEFYSYGAARELVNWFMLPDIGVEETDEGWKITYWPLGGSMETTEEQEVTIPKPPPPDGSSISTNDAGGVEIKGWADAAKCGESLSGMLTEQSDEGRNSHEILARVKSGGTTSLHYVEIGDRLDTMPQPDNESVVTNGGKVAVRGWEDNKATKYAVPHTGSDALAWRGFGDFFESATFDWTAESGKVKPKGYGAGVGNSHYFGTGANGGVGWWELPNVTTNYVQGDDVTITSTTVGAMKTLGLKDWNANYGGSFPLFLVNDRGALGYYPLPEPITNEWDNASIASNSTDKIEIKGFATGTPRCNADLFSMLTETAEAYPEKSKHLLLSRYKDGNADPVLHWIPFPAGALETGGADADGVTIVTNAAQGAATQGLASIAGYSTATNGTVLTRTANGVEWKPVAATSGSFAYSGGVIGAGAVTVGRQAYKVNESGTAAGSGNWRVKVELSPSGVEPTITVESGDGFAAPPSGTTSYFPLYELDSDGNVVHDWRGTFVVPAYEQGSY